ISPMIGIPAARAAANAGSLVAKPGLTIISSASNKLSAFSSPNCKLTPANSCWMLSKCGGCKRVSNNINGCCRRAKKRATDKPVIPVPITALSLLLAINSATVVVSLTQFQGCQADQHQHHTDNPEAHNHARLRPAF